MTDTLLDMMRQAISITRYLQLMQLWIQQFPSAKSLVISLLGQLAYYMSPHDLLQYPWLIQTAWSTLRDTALEETSTPDEKKEEEEEEEMNMSKKLKDEKRIANWNATFYANMIMETVADLSRYETNKTMKTQYPVHQHIQCTPNLYTLNSGTMASIHSFLKVETLTFSLGS
jgi:hypothetical protein